MAYFNQTMKQAMAPKIKTVLNKYGMKGTLSVRNHSTVVLNLSQGPLDFGADTPHWEGYTSVNVYWIDKHYTGRTLEFLKEVMAVLYEGNWNNSDIQTDYFDVGWYVDINVGRWEKTYVFTGNMESV